MPLFSRDGVRRSMRLSKDGATARHEAFLEGGRHSGVLLSAVHRALHIFILVGRAVP